MAAQATALWRVRSDGDDLNGGSYDPAYAGGSDLTDQVGPALSLTDLETTGALSTTLTSVTGGFTSALIGNAFRISSGTNFTPGYYWVVSVTDGNTLELDSSPTSSAAGAGGVGRIGGAFATYIHLSPASTPSIPSPLIAGNTVYVRGSGTDTPSTPDYDYGSDSTLYTYPDGTGTNWVRWIGYNGRPRITANGAHFYWQRGHWLENFDFYRGSGDFGSGMIRARSYDGGGFEPVAVVNCRFTCPVNGVACMANYIHRCSFFSTTGDQNTVRIGRGGGTITDSWFEACQRNSISFEGFTLSIVENCVFTKTQGAGGTPVIRIVSDNADNATFLVRNNVFHSVLNDAIRFENNARTNTKVAIQNNIFSEVGGFGVTSLFAALNNTNAYSHGNAFHQMSSGAWGNGLSGYDDINLTASPFLDPDAGVFQLNRDPAGGALLRNTINLIGTYEV